MIAILLFVSIVSNVVMDVLIHDYHSSIFSRLNPSYWNPEESWANKYKEGTNKPRFFLSTTVFVIFTDAWHLFQFIFHSSWQLAVVWNMADGITVLWYFLALKTVFSAGFEVLYRLSRTNGR